MRPGRPNPVLLAIVVEGFLSRLSFGLISFALPLYAYRMGMSLTAIGFLSSLNLVVALMLKPTSGSAVDRVGLKLGLLAAMILRSLVSLLLAFATLPWHLFATRAVHGVSISVRDPAVNALIAENGGKRSVATAFAWYQTAKSVAGALGKVLAGLLLGLTASNFSLVFGVAFALSALPIAIVALYVPASASSAMDMSRSQQPAVVESAGPRPPMLPFMSLGFLVSGTAYMLTNLFPIFAVEYAGLTEAQAGLIYSLSAVVVLAGPVFGWLSDHVSRKLVLSIRSAANVLSSAIYLVAPNLAGMATGRVVDDLGKAAFRPGWGALMAHVSSFDKRRRGRTMGYLSAGEDAGEVTGPILAGFLWSMWGVPALLGVRIAFAVVTEVYTITLSRSLRRLEMGATETVPPATASERRAEPAGRTEVAGEHAVAPASRVRELIAEPPADIGVESERLSTVVGSQVSTILAAAEESAHRIVSDARAEAEAVRAEADAYAEKRRRDARDNAARVTVRAAFEARALERARAESQRRLEEEAARHEELLRVSQTVQDGLRHTISSGQAALDRLESVVVDGISRPPDKAGSGSSEEHGAIRERA
jgi:MFS family permease